MPPTAGARRALRAGRLEASHPLPGDPTGACRHGGQAATDSPRACTRRSRTWVGRALANGHLRHPRAPPWCTSSPPRSLDRVGRGGDSRRVLSLPPPLGDEVRSVAARLGVKRLITQAELNELAIGGERDPRAIARRLWPLDELATRHREFIERYSFVPDELERTRVKHQRIPDTAFLSGALAMGVAFQRCFDEDPPPSCSRAPGLAEQRGNSWPAVEDSPSSSVRNDRAPPLSHVRRDPRNPPLARRRPHRRKQPISARSTIATTPHTRNAISAPGG